MKAPSVTQVLSPWADFSRVPQEALENAARRGTDVHRACSALAQGLWFPPVPDDCAGYLASFRLWLPTVADVVLAEDELSDHRLGFVGHPDLIVRINGDHALTVVDLKTPAVVNSLWRVQLAAYKHLAKANGMDVRRALSLRLRQDGGRPIVNEYTDSAQDMAAFVAALNAYRYFNRNAA